ncbi:MAG TPA: hypothetical protein VD838_05075, partial [Anaeromyxobacteraceae bacterium]|nr:hypothetical protein [Anaeromyxobacteraceae bacterium]
LVLAPVCALAQSSAGQHEMPAGDQGGGPLLFVFLGFAVAAIVVVFLVFRWLRRPPERPPFNRPRA